MQLKGRASPPEPAAQPGCRRTPADPFEPHVWLRARQRGGYDEEDIGVLAVPAPKLEDMSAQVSAAYAFLADLDDDERLVAQGRAQDRPVVLTMLGELGGGRLRDIALR